MPGLLGYCSIGTCGFLLFQVHVETPALDFFSKRVTLGIDEAILLISNREENMCQLDRLRRLKAEIYQIARKHNASKVYVFGSCARKEETPESDVDVLVELNLGASLFDLMDLQDSLETLLQCKVDVVSKRGLNPYIKKQVLQEAIAL